MKNKFQRNRKVKVKREEPKKDSKSKRINLDNERESKFKEDIKTWMNRGDSNDIRWYSHVPARVTAAGRIPFAAINGVTTIGDGDSTYKYAAPGVMRIDYAPNFVPNQAVIEQAYQAMYSDIVHANSRNQTYDYTDLAIMHQAGTEIFAAIALGIRVYGLMRMYTEPNAYTPRQLVAASGFNFKDLQANLSHMWDDLLQLIAQSRQIWLPNTMPIIERRMWMNLHVYKDAETDQAQYYMYTPSRFFKYEGYTDKKGGMLTALNVTVDDMKWANYMSYVQQMIDALIPDQDRGIMFGDILKAYGKENIFAINDIALDYITIPTYNKEVLWQIENLTLCAGSPVTMYQTNLKLSQTWNSEKTFTDTDTWTNTVARYMVPKTVLMNFHQAEQPTPEQIMIASRMTVSGTMIQTNSKYNAETKKWESESGKLVITPAVGGTEIATGLRIYFNKYDGRILNMSNTIVHYISTILDSLMILMWSAFDWAPMLYSLRGGNNIKEQPMHQYVIGEYDNYSELSQENIKALHNAAIYSLYNVPTL